MNGKSNHKLKSLKINASYNSYTMFVNEYIIRIYLFSPWNTRQMHFKRSYVTKTCHPPWPPKIPHCGGGGLWVHVEQLCTLRQWSMLGNLRNIKNQSPPCPPKIPHGVVGGGAGAESMKNGGEPLDNDLCLRI